MNYNQFIQRQKDMYGIPEFKNTEEAEQFGLNNRGNTAIIELLKEERERLVSYGRKLMDEGNEAEALRIASGQCQFVREALQKAE